MADIGELIALTTSLGRVVSPNIRCAGLSLNTSRLDEAAARAELGRLAQLHKVPAVDPVRFGAGELVDALLSSG
jgi:uncharacterized NAD-dependent epimerase/dehydratase family protein